MTGEWLSLSEAAQMLGVHPSTVRNWADQGEFHVQRTQGGHRRFRRQDVELWIRSRPDAGSIQLELVSQSVLSKTRMHISEGHLENEEWYCKLDDEARQQYRHSGRSLLQGLITHLNSDECDLEAEARSLGYEYASRGRRCGLSIVEAAHAYLFFRTVMLEALLNVYQQANVRSPQAWTNMFHKFTTFTDLIMITLLETYEAFQRGNR